MTPPVTHQWRARRLYWFLATVILVFTTIGLFQGFWFWALPLYVYAGFNFLVPHAFQAVSNLAYLKGLEVTPWPICEHGNDATICDECWAEFTGPSLWEQIRYRWALIKDRFHTHKGDPF